MISQEVLLIHDRINVSQVIEAGFGDIADWRVYRCNSFKSLLLKITLSPPDLIILDLEFPEMDGVEVLKTIRNYLDCETPVVVFTTRPLTYQEEHHFTKLKVLKVVYS